MVRRAKTKKEIVESTASVWRCSQCRKVFPSTQMVVATTYVDGKLEIVHSCKGCEPLIQEKDARKLIKRYSDMKKNNVSVDEWKSWYDGLTGYIFKDCIKRILINEKKVSL
jgi:hypothetical protein